MSHLGRRLSALIDSELTGTERDRVLSHLASCHRCRQEAAALRKLKRRLHALGEATADAELPRHVISRAAAAGQHRPGPGRPGRQGRAARRGRSGSGRGRPGPSRRPGQSRRPRRRRAGIAAVSAFSLLAAGLAVAAFLAGGGRGQPGPDVTPAVDIYMVQHGVTGGAVPVSGPGSRGRTAPARHAGRSAGQP